MKVAFDTNILLDAILGRAESESANALIKAVLNDRIDGILTANTITDIYYVARKSMGENDAREAVFEILSIFEIAPVTGEACLTALELPMYDFEDAVLAACVKEADADFIATRDQGFISSDGSPVKALRPAEILEILGEK
ncbi:MAG: PIN domain-containing protein [Oscillospiraceae bacterium]|nr:PIN domain-containing protein [Oscillospiraceae bacterium]